MTRQELPKGLSKVLRYAAMEEQCVFEPMAEECGYKRKTTFFSDLSIAECEGVAAIKDTFNRVMESWCNDVVFFTEFILSLNWKSWEWNDRGDEEFVRLYSDLYNKADTYAYEHFKGDDLKYYFSVTD